MTTLPKQKDSQERLRLSPRRKSCSELFMQRMRQAIQQTYRNCNVKAETPANVVSFALKMRTEAMGIRASGRVLEKSHTSIMRWEQKAPQIQRSKP